jgi:hypothetical protein
VLLGGAAIQAQTWMPAAHRFKGTFDNGLVGNYGIQFQRVITWNEGTADPAKRGWVLTGQDENGVRASYDYGATWNAPRLSGMFCSKIAGLYLNTDEDLFLALGGMFGRQEFPGISVDGIYRGDGTLLRATRVEITRPGGPGPDASGGGKRAFTDVSYAGNSVIRSSNFLARRPQTGGLSDLERPIWALEQILTSGSISYIALFKSTDAGRSFTFVRDLAVSEYSSGNDGIYHILAAPNGDVVLLGKRGLWLSQDQGVNFARIHPSSGAIEISAGYFFGGGTDQPSGMRIGVYASNANGGVWETANIRTTAFSKPNGNAGLPANYRVWHLGSSPVNPDRLAVCSDSTTPSLAPYLSTDGGKTFTVIAEGVGTGDEQWRYNVRRGHAGFHFCPTDEFICLVPTFQTMARSLDGAERSDGDLVAGFDGLHAKGVGFDAWSGDWKKILRICQDSWINTSTDGMHWLAQNGLGTGSSAFKADLNAAGAGGSNPQGYASGAGGVICPNNRMIAAANTNTGGQTNVMVVAEMNADGTTRSYYIATPQVRSRATHSRRSQKNPDVAFVGRWAISNLSAPNPADVVFTDHGGHEIFDCFLDGNTLISYWANVSTGGSDDGTQIFRSTDDMGSNNQGAPWFVLQTSSFGESSICADHHNPERVLYVRNDDRNVIREVRRVDGVLRDDVLRNAAGQPVNLRTMPGGILDILASEIGAPATVQTSATAITQLIADPNQPGLFYAIAGMHGMPNWWRTEDNGVTWTNVSGNAPRTLWSGVVHPLTGEVMGFSSMGEHILPAPATYPDIPNKNALTNQLKAYFAAAPKAPIVSAIGDAASGTDVIRPPLPTGITTGDILLLVVETANEAVFISDVNGGSWLQVGGSPQGSGTAGAGDATRLTAFWSRYNGSQGAPVLSDSGDHQTARMIAIRGAALSGDPWNVALGGVDAMVSPGGTIPGATTTLDNALVILAVSASHPDSTGTANFSGWSNTNLSALVERGDSASDSGKGGALGIATGIKALAGGFSGTAVTLAQPASKAMLTLAIRRAAPGVVLSSQDIGSPGQAGSTVYDANTGAYTVTGGGADIAGTSDQFRFVSQSWAGDGRIIARVASVQDTHPWAKAGLMFREGMEAGAVHANFFLSSQNGTQLAHRESTGGATIGDAHVTGVAAPYWLRLERRGNIFTAWQSPDGDAWFQAGSTSFAMAADVWSGLAVTSHEDALLSTAVFDHVRMEGVPAWTAADVGFVGSTGNTVHEYASDVITLNSSGADIGGEGDAFHFYHQVISGDAMVIAEVTSVENVHPNAKAGVMIRQSLSRGAAQAYIGLTAGGAVEFLRRESSGAGTSQDVLPGVAAPRFIKLVRTGSLISAYHSPDGGVWTQLGPAVAIPMNGPVLAGVAGCSIVNSPYLYKSTFESVFVKTNEGS